MHVRTINGKKIGHELEREQREVYGKGSEKVEERGWVL